MVVQRGRRLWLHLLPQLLHHQGDSLGAVHNGLLGVFFEEEEEEEEQEETSVAARSSSGQRIVC